MNITPSDTPLKRYNLRCPSCGEYDISLPTSSPETPFCGSCEDNVDMGDIHEFIKAWHEYLCDRAAFLEKEGKEEE